MSDDAVTSVPSYEFNSEQGKLIGELGRAMRLVGLVAVAYGVLGDRSDGDRGLEDRSPGDRPQPDPGHLSRALGDVGRPLVPRSRHDAGQRHRPPDARPGQARNIFKLIAILLVARDPDRGRRAGHRALLPPGGFVRRGLRPSRGMSRQEGLAASPLRSGDRSIMPDPRCRTCGGDDGPEEPIATLRRRRVDDRCARASPLRPLLSGRPPSSSPSPGLTSWSGRRSGRDAGAERARDSVSGWNDTRA